MRSFGHRGTNGLCSNDYPGCESLSLCCDTFAHGVAGVTSSPEKFPHRGTTTRRGDGDPAVPSFDNSANVLRMRAMRCGTSFRHCMNLSHRRLGWVSSGWPLHRLPQHWLKASMSVRPRPQCNGQQASVRAREACSKKRRSPTQACCRDVSGLGVAFAATP